MALRNSKFKLLKTDTFRNSSQNIHVLRFVFGRDSSHDFLNWLNWQYLTRQQCLACFSWFKYSHNTLLTSAVSTGLFMCSRSTYHELTMNLMRITFHIRITFYSELLIYYHYLTMNLIRIISNWNYFWKSKTFFADPVVITFGTSNMEQVWNQLSMYFIDFFTYLFSVS